MIKKIFLFIILLFLCVKSYGGHLYLNTGIESQFKSYSKEDNSTTFHEGSQIDKLFFETDFQRDFYRGRLGDFKLKLNINQFNLNYFNNTNPNYSIPFTKDNSAYHQSKTIYTLYNRLHIKLPKQKLDMFAEFSKDTNLDIDSNNYFNSLPKIQTDVRELEGINTSLSNYNETNMQSYYIYKYGKINLMGSYTTYSYTRKLDSDVNYLKTDRYKLAGFDIRRILGFHFEQNIQKFNLGENDSDKKTYKFGMIDAFGYTTTYKIKNIEISVYGEKTDEIYEGEKYKKDFYSSSLKLNTKNHIAEIKYTYEYKEDKYTNNTTKVHHGLLRYDYKTKNLKVYTNAIFKRTNYISPNILHKTYTFANGSTVISNGMKGSGYIIITNDSSSNILIDLTNLIVDDNNYSPTQVAIAPNSDYQINFNSSIIGNITLLTGNQDDISITIYKESGFEYIRDNYEFNLRYDYKLSEIVTSKFKTRITYSKLNSVYDPNNVINTGREYTYMFDKTFEIRPHNIIFDKQLSYNYDKYTNSKYSKFSISSKDGYYSLKNKFYLKSYFDKYNYSESNNRYSYKFRLNAEHFSQKVTIQVFPEYEYEKEYNNYQKKINTFDTNIKYTFIKLYGKYRKEKTEYTNDYITKIAEKKIYLTLNSRNLIFENKFEEYKNIYISQKLFTNLKFIKYKTFPFISPYAIIELGYERDRDNAEGIFKNDDYIILKITYTPTTRLKGIFSFEKEIDKSSNKGIDYEGYLSYQTRLFKAAFGYRKTTTIIDGKRRKEDEIFFEIRKNFGFYYGNHSRRR